MDTGGGATTGQKQQSFNGNHSDVDDNFSVFSESIVEREGVTRNPKLILPEIDDDAFFDL